MILKVTKGLFSSRNVGIDVFKVKGDFVIEKNIYAVMFGDYVSLYLAALPRWISATSTLLST